MLITAGPTHEPIDSVRYIANRSSGRMGISLAEASASRGWPTTLLLGPTPLGPPQHPHIRTFRFQTVDDLQRLLHAHWPQHDVLLMAAAVADYRPIPHVNPETKTQHDKIKRKNAPLMLELHPTPDLLAELAATTRANQFLVGFALEPADRLMESAQQKLTRKNLHAIVANPLETMDSPTIDGRLIFANGSSIAPGKELPKPAFAQWLLDSLQSRLLNQGG